MRPVVVGALDPVVGHLALDHARVGAEATLGQWLLQDLVDGVSQRAVEGVRGKNPDGTGWCGARLAGCG